MPDRTTEQHRKRDAARTLEALYEISSAVNATRNLDELYAEIHSALGKIFNVSNFYIALHHEDRDSISFPYHVDEVDEVSEEIFDFSQTSSLTGLVITEQKPRIFRADEIEALGRQRQRKTIGTVSKVWIGAPLIIRDKVIGVIALQSYKSEQAFTRSDLDLLNSVSHHIALAIERKESDEKLADQQQLLQKILETSPVGIAYLEDRVFKWVNQEMIRLFGYTDKSEMENNSVRMIYDTDQDYHTTGRMISTRLHEKGKYEFEYLLKRKDHTLFPGSIILASFDPENMMKAIIAIISDNSEQKQAEKEKMEREKLQGVLEMAGAICHELNQPLQTIIGYSSLFKTPEEIRIQDLECIKEQAARIGEITRRLATITDYRTIDYPGNTKIVDIWGADRKPG